MPDSSSISRNDEGSGCAQTSNEDLLKGCLEHYDRVSTIACEWNNQVPQAIRAWYAAKSSPSAAKPIERCASGEPCSNTETGWCWGRCMKEYAPQSEKQQHSKPEVRDPAPLDDASNGSADRAGGRPAPSHSDKMDSHSHGLLPDCMMPDGAEPCAAYQHLERQLADVIRQRDFYAAKVNGTPLSADRTIPLPQADGRWWHWDGEKWERADTASAERCSKCVDLQQLLESARHANATNYATGATWKERAEKAEAALQSATREPTEAMVDAAAAFLNEGSFLSHPKVRAFNGTANGDSQEAWNRDYIKELCLVVLNAADRS